MKGRIEIGINLVAHEYKKSDLLPFTNNIL